MLKRQQVLLEDWLVDYIKHLSALYDLSFSEIIRISLCLECLDITSHLYPQFKLPMSKGEIIKIIKKAVKGAKGSEESHKFISTLYFEARKAAECRMAKEKRLIK